MSNIQIKTYDERYKEEITQLKIQTKEFELPVSLNDQPDLLEIKTFYQAGCGNFWVALSDDKVVGTVALIDIANKQTALRKMFVDENYRGKEKNIAKRLIDELMSWCKQKHVNEVYLGTTPFFLAAHRFYEKNGFVEISKDSLPTAFPVMRLDTKFYCYRFV